MTWRAARPAAWLIWAMPVLAAGCVAHVSEVELPVDCRQGCEPAAFSDGGTVEAPQRWWRAFDDPALDRLVEGALAANLDLAEVWYRLREAQAVAEIRESDLWPDADAFAEASVEDSSGGDDFGDGDDGGFNGGGFGGGEDFFLGLSAGYEVDLWGGIRSAVEAERLRTRAALADYHTAAISLAAEVARTWYQLVETRAQVALLEEQIEASATILGLLENRFGSGQVRGVDVLRQRQLVEATREQRITALARRGVLENRLAALLGRPPWQEVATTTTTLPRMPPLPATGVPTELVARRPDVRSAYLRLQAADRDLAAAVTRRYPRLTLSASLSTGGSSAADLFDDWARSLAGGLLAPLFRAGELAAGVERSEAVRQQLLHAWGRATLAAWQEVEDALVREARQVQRVASLERQVELTEQAYEQLRVQYFNGMGDYIDVLTALTEAQRVRRDLLAARRQTLELRIGLYRALAGGLEAEPGPEAGPDAARTAPETS